MPGSRAALGLPETIDGCLFDLDGVITQTAQIHALAWKDTFDEFMRLRAEQSREAFVPFDLNADYRVHVDGRTRMDGVQAFLASRGIELSRQKAIELGERKNALFRSRIARAGVSTYPDSIPYLRAVAQSGLPSAIVTSSANADLLISSVGLGDLVEVVIDGRVAAQRGLHGKPAPDTFLEGARVLGVEPKRAAVFEDAQAGVQAGRIGDFGLVIGVDRIGQAEALRRAGADVVVEHLGQMSFTRG